jgi:uncharacterized protein
MTSDENKNVILELNKWAKRPVSWLYPPVAALINDGKLSIRSAADTDYWQRTHYGFRRDNGHFLYCSLDTDFTMTVFVQGHPSHQYDQAGILVRHSDACWAKASVEFEPECLSRLGSVVTNHGWSDWATQDIDYPTGRIGFRIQRVGNDFTFHVKVDASSDWSQIRIAHLHETADHSVPLMCGVYLCSPQGGGFEASFDSFTIA